MYYKNKLLTEKKRKSDKRVIKLDEEKNNNKDIDQIKNNITCFYGLAKYYTDKSLASDTLNQLN